MKKKNIIIVICTLLAIGIVALVLAMSGNSGNVSNVNRVVGYSALYDDNLINEACRVVEQKFAEEFEGCTLTELRYDAEVETVTKTIPEKTETYTEEGEAFVGVDPDGEAIY